MKLSERIKSRREQLQISQEELAQKMGYRDRSTIAKIEQGINDITQSKIIAFAAALETTPAYLMGWTDDPYDYELDPQGRLHGIPSDMLENLEIIYAGDKEKIWRKYWDEGAAGIQEALHALHPEKWAGSSEMAIFPILGNIAAGYGGQAIEEQTGDYEQIPISMLHGHSPEDFFVLRVKGDSMYPHIINGDKVLVQRSTSVDSGAIAVVLYNGEDATVKKVNYVYGEDWLELLPINPEYKPKRIEGRELEECRVLGKVVKLIRDLG